MELFGGPGYQLGCQRAAKRRPKRSRGAKAAPGRFRDDIFENLGVSKEGPAGVFWESADCRMASESSQRPTWEDFGSIWKVC